MGNDNKTDIRIQTVPNGYMLDIHKEGVDKGYLYFTLSTLLEGFIYHIGMEELKAITNEHIHEIIEASMTWRDKRENVFTILQMKTEAQAMTESISTLCCKIDDQRHLLSQLRRKNTVLRKTIKEYEELCANHGIKGIKN